MKKEILKNGTIEHPALTRKWKFSERSADTLTRWMGSWTFIIIFAIIFITWISLNTYFLIAYNLTDPWDPFPFILLNLVLSCLASLQAPIILMSQNRQSQKDRLRTEYDYAVNRKAEREIQEIRKQLDKIEGKIR